jgi:hypothetical protein
MMNTGIVALRWSVKRSLSVLIGCAILGSGHARGDGPDDAGRLVREAVHADLGGQREQRDAALARAVQIAPDFALARWHSGQIRVDDLWVDLGDAQRGAQAEGVIAEYSRLRNLHANSPRGHRSLAHFCQRHGLKDRERLHWLAVLQVQPGNKEAIRSLGLRPHQGRLLTLQQIQWLESQQERWSDAEKKWNPLLSEARKAIVKGTTEQREAAQAQLRAIDDPDAIPFAEQVLSDQSDELTAELVALAGRIDDPMSTELLVRYAVGSDSKDIRSAAIGHLKRRNWYTFVPALMGALATPVEMSFSAIPVAEGMVASISFSREGPQADFAQHLRMANLEASARGMRRLATRAGARGRPIPGPSGGPRTAQIRGETAAAANQAANRAMRETEAENRRVQFWNQRIDAVLSEVTGQQIDGQAQSWWQWWQEYNDLYVPEDKPLVERESEFIVGTSQDRIATCECFLPGTPVWTETGPVPIERIRVGDRVLAQDPDSGELAHKLVLQTTARPNAATVRVGIGDEEIYATKGHPFWVSGRGWKMARTLQPGCRLHTPTGSREVTHIGEGPEFQAHNLLVADFRSFFVGQTKILVHDNTVRRHTAAIVPGVAGE